MRASSAERSRHSVGVPNAQVERLWHRRADLCPKYGAERTLLARAADQARKFNKMVSLAGRAALAFFTGGASGGLLP